MKTDGSISRTASVSGYVSENSPVVTAGVTAAAASQSRQSLRQLVPGTRGIRLPSGR